MKKALPFILVLFALFLTAPGAAFAGRSVESLFKGKADASYRVPNAGAVTYLLEKAHALPLNATPEQRQQAVDKYLSEFVRHNQDTPNPAMYRKLLENEENGTAPKAADRSLKSLVVLAEFNPQPDTFISETDSDGNCVDTEVTFEGPLHNQIPPPGPRDNNTLWYDNTTPDLYSEIYFGEGPTAGVIVNHPNLGPVDLRGKTMVNYYLELSKGKFAPSGKVYPKWFQAEHSEAYYGQEGCNGSSNVHAEDLVDEMLVAINSDNPDFDWQTYDGNADGWVDNFTVIHAGMGQEAGGGSLGNFAIWSHASMVGYPDGRLVCKAGSTGCPDRDIRVGSYSMDPENLDLGVISEEFGHAALGLPDIYTTDGQLSVANWAIMEAGSWNGILGGTEPAPFPLWFKYMLGWSNVKEINYNDPALTTKVGQLEKTPSGMYDGIKINLPKKNVSFANPFNTGKAWWSSTADGAKYSLTHDFDLTNAKSPVFSFNSAWSIEEDYDYGLFEVSDDGGQTWTSLNDTGDHFAHLKGWFGLTGEGIAKLSFDLAGYVGKSIKVRLLYLTDPGVQWKGWCTDDFALKDGSTTLWSDNVESGNKGWAVDGGWTFVPFTKAYDRYYLVEWRNNQGFDHGLMYPYTTVYYDEDEWKVDRAPYTVPGMLVYFRDSSYSTDYTLYDSIYDGPSWGTKHALILVDSHYWPLEWNDYQYASGAYLRVDSRVQPGNASFTLQPTKGFTLHLGYNPITGDYLNTPIQTKTFAPLPAVMGFHDSLGYYPGFYLGPDNILYFWDWQASAVIPAKGDYTSRITTLDKKPDKSLYGFDLGGTILGSGNPGAENKQFGLHIVLANKATDGTYGVIQTWNSMALSSINITPKAVTYFMGSNLLLPGGFIQYTVEIKNTTPFPQKINASGTLPAFATFLTGQCYNPVSKGFKWAGTLAGNATQTCVLNMRVNTSTPHGTVLRATGRTTDDALGSSTQATITVR